jgi:hypothetical protein
MESIQGKLENSQLKENFGDHHPMPHFTLARLSWSGIGQGGWRISRLPSDEIFHLGSM